MVLTDASCDDDWQLTRSGRGLGPLTIPRMSGTDRGKLAERVGFEPTWGDYAPIRFRVGAVMTASVPLRGRRILYKQ
jgi:hypothetical protein